MTEIAKTLRAAWDALFFSKYERYLDDQIRWLRGHVAQLQLELREVRNPQTAAPAPPRQFPKFTPAKTSWESYVAEQMALQEKEEQPVDGTHSSGRV